MEMIFRKLVTPTLVKVVWWTTVVVAVGFVAVSEYFGLRLWGIALGVGADQPTTEPTPTDFPTDTPVEGDEGDEGFPPPEDPFGVLAQLTQLLAQFLLGSAVAMIVLPPVLAALWVMWTRLALEYLATFHERGTETEDVVRSRHEGPADPARGHDATNPVGDHR